MFAESGMRSSGLVQLIGNGLEMQHSRRKMWKNCGRILIALMAAMWIGSTRVGFAYQGTAIFLGISRGQIELAVNRPFFEADKNPSETSPMNSTSGAASNQRWLFDNGGAIVWTPTYEEKILASSLIWRQLSIPIWIPLTLSVFWVWYLSKSTKNFPENCCINCGYQLRGNKSGRCPECGTAIGKIKKGHHCSAENPD